jgi:hypothetical protein
LPNLFSLGKLGDIGACLSRLRRGFDIRTT